jgi:hypothetical protein
MHLMNNSMFFQGWKYEGEWFEDEITGQGKLTCPRQEGALRGDVYEGTFCNGLPHGMCKYQRSDGQFQDGEWMQGDFIGGDSCLKFSNGASYVGKCLGNKPHGLGTMKCEDGRTVTGVFEQGKFPLQAHMQVTESTIDSVQTSYEATFRGFLGTKMGLNALKGRLPKPLHLNKIDGHQAQDLKEALSARSRHFESDLRARRTPRVARSCCVVLVMCSLLVDRASLFPAHSAGRF